MGTSKVYVFPIYIMVDSHLFYKKCEIRLNTWIVSAAVSLVVAPLSVVLLFYSYTGALGIESVFIDILLVFVCYFIALWVASHFLKYSKPDNWAVIISVIVIAVIFIAFIVFTFAPPRNYQSSMIQ